MSVEHWRVPHNHDLGYELDQTENRWIQVPSRKRWYLDDIEIPEHAAHALIEAWQTAHRRKHDTGVWRAVHHLRKLLKP